MGGRHGYDLQQRRGGGYAWWCRTNQNAATMSASLLGSGEWSTAVVRTNKTDVYSCTLEAFTLEEA